VPGALAEPVAVDTSIWIDGLRDGASRAALEALVPEGRALLPAPAVTELLLGARPGRERAALGELFEVTRVVTPAEEDYREAGEIGSRSGWRFLCGASTPTSGRSHAT
jgi:predicted nucleic acid-binding protein